jgi:hypothetical protein
MRLPALVGGRFFLCAALLQDFQSICKEKHITVVAGDIQVARETVQKVKQAGSHASPA